MGGVDWLIYFFFPGCVCVFLESVERSSAPIASTPRLSVFRFKVVRTILPVELLGGEEDT